MQMKTSFTQIDVCFFVLFCLYTLEMSVRILAV